MHSDASVEIHVEAFEDDASDVVVSVGDDDDNCQRATTMPRLCPWLTAADVVIVAAWSASEYAAAVRPRGKTLEFMRSCAPSFVGANLSKSCSFCVDDEVDIPERAS